MLPFFADCYQLCSSSRCLGPFSSTYLYYYYLLLYFLHSKIPPPCIFLTCEVQLYCKMYVYSRNLPYRLNHEFSVDRKSKKNVRRVWRYQRGNQNLSVGRKKALKKSLKIPKRQSESVYRRRTVDTMAKRKRTKGQTTINKTYIKFQKLLNWLYTNAQRIIVRSFKYLFYLCRLSKKASNSQTNSRLTNTRLTKNFCVCVYPMKNKVY
jgi:hypothetical protein